MFFSKSCYQGLLTHLQNYVFSVKTTGDSVADQDLMIVVTLHCLPELPPRIMFSDPGMGLMATTCKSELSLFVMGMASLEASLGE